MSAAGAPTRPARGLHWLPVTAPPRALPRAPRHPPTPSIQHHPHLVCCERAARRRQSLVPSPFSVLPAPATTPALAACSPLRLCLLRETIVHAVSPRHKPNSPAPFSNNLCQCRPPAWPPAVPLCPMQASLLLPTPQRCCSFHHPDPAARPRVPDAALLCSPAPPTWRRPFAPFPPAPVDRLLLANLLHPAPQPSVSAGLAAAHVRAIPHTCPPRLSRPLLPCPVACTRPPLPPARSFQTSPFHHAFFHQHPSGLSV